MPWKVDENGTLVMDDKSNPVWITESDEERSVDYPAIMKGLGEAKREAAQRKDRIKEMENKLKVLEGIEDFEEFKSQAEKDRLTVSSMADKDKSNEDRIKAQVEAATKPLHEIVSKLKAEKAEADARLQKETITNAFARSAFITEKVHPKARAAVADVFQRHFAVNEEGKLVAIGSDGNVIYGENGAAEFDEAISRLIEGYPGKEIFLAGKDSDGGGSDPGRTGSPSRGGPKKFTECKTAEEEVAFLRTLTAE